MKICLMAQQRDSGQRERERVEAQGVKPANLEREGLVFRELNEENWSGVVAGESSCLSEEST